MEQGESDAELGDLGLGELRADHRLLVGARCPAGSEERVGQYERCLVPRRETGVLPTIIDE